MIKPVTISALLLLLPACAKAPLLLDHPDLATARSAIAEARAADGEKCAPQEMALAVSALYQAAHELDEAEHLSEFRQLVGQAGTHAVHAQQICRAAKEKKNQPRKATDQTGAPADSVIYFSFDKSALTEQSKTVLDGVAQQMEQQPDAHLTVHGHTCSIGSGKYNQLLSERRARSAQAYLLGHGLNQSDIKIRAHGERQPVHSNKTEEGRKKNRRVELIFNLNSSLN
jgi:outer membrane protein OmpA-like peptidoglycan-associated protein